MYAVLKTDQWKYFSNPQELYYLPEDPAEIEKADHVSDTLNPESLNVLKDCLVEPSLVGAKPGTRYQFLRQACARQVLLVGVPGVYLDNRLRVACPEGDGNIARHQ